MKNKDVKRGIVLYLDGKEVKSDVTSIKAEIRKLTKELDRMTIGSKEYNAQMAKIKGLNSMLRDHKQQLRAVNEEVTKGRINFGKFVDGFNRFGGFIASAAAALTGFVLGLRALRDERNKLEDSQHSLQALTGLDDNAIAWLTNQAKELSTTMTKEGLRVRQSANEILDAFMLVGSAKPELLGNKEALAAVTEEAMRLQAAAGDISLQQAVDSLTLSLNQYGASAEQASRYVNVLAAGSKAGAANIASQANAIKKTGTIAAASNVSIEELVGTIEMLGEKGIKDEIAGTALKRFFNRLSSGAKDTNPKLVGLATALDNLNKKVQEAEAQSAGGGTTLLNKLFGEDGMQVAMVLSQNTEKVKEYTKAVTGTNVAYEQSAINSDTASAKLAQARNQLKLAGIELAEKLTPAIRISTNAMTYVIKLLPGLIDWFREWGAAVVYLGGICLVYATRLKIVAAYTATVSAVTKAATIVKLAYGVAMTTVSGYTVTSIKNLRLLYTAMAAHPKMLAALRVATYAYAAAVQLLHGRVDLAAKAMRGAWAIMTANPVGLLTTALLAAVAVSYKLTKNIRDYYNLEKVNKSIRDKTKKDIEEQTSRIDELTSVINDNSLSNYARRKALDELKKIVPDYHADLDREGILINNNTDALQRYNKLLGINAELKNVISELDEHRVNLLKLQRQADTLAKDNSLMAGMARTDHAEKLRKEQEIVDSLTDRYKDLVTEKERVLKPVNPKPATPAKETGNGGSGESEEERKKRVNAELEKIETRHMQQMTHLQRLYLEGQIVSEEEYTALQIDLEKKTLDEKLKIAGLEPHKREELQVKMLEAQIKFRDECKKEDEKAEKERLRIEEKTAKERLAVRKRQLRDELHEASLRHFNNLTSEEDFAKEVNDIRQRYWDDLVNNYKLTNEQIDEVQEEQQNSYEERSKKKYEEAMRMKDFYSNLAKDTAAEYGETLGDMIANGELSMKNFLRETILMALDALERVLQITYVEILAKKIATAGFIGAAEAALQITAIKAAFAVAKGMVSNFYTGGYTGPGDWDQPQGVVHSNEFVANRFAVANPAVRPVLDLIDNAQRTGSISNLTAQDIASVVGSGRSQDKPATPVIKVLPEQSDKKMLEVLNALTDTVASLKSRLDEPIVAETYVTGKRGINQGMKDYNTLKKNIARIK